MPYFAWAGAEIAVAMICVGIPTLRPLYLRTRGKTGAYASHAGSNSSELPQFTMFRNKPAEGPAMHDSPISPSKMEAGLTKPANVYIRVQRGSSEALVASKHQEGGYI